MSFRESFSTRLYVFGLTSVRLNVGINNAAAPKAFHDADGSRGQLRFKTFQAAFGEFSMSCFCEYIFLLLIFCLLVIMPILSSSHYLCPMFRCPITCRGLRENLSRGTLHRLNSILPHMLACLPLRHPFPNCPTMSLLRER